MGCANEEPLTNQRKAQPANVLSVEVSKWKNVGVHVGGTTDKSYQIRATDALREMQLMGHVRWMLSSRVK